MPYPINRSDGTLLTTISDYTRDTESTSLTLLGRGSVDYGESVAENFVHLLESFASPTPPANPLPGQTWFHTFDPGPPIKNVQKLKVFNGLEWVPVGGASNSVDPPESPQPGDLWYNVEEKRIYYWDGENWKPVGGPYVGTPYDPDNPDNPDPEAPNSPPPNPQEGDLWWMLPERKLWGYDASLASISSFPPNVKRQNGSTVPNGWVLIGPDGVQNPNDPNGGSYTVITNITVINPDTQEEEEVPMHIVVVDGKIVAVWSADLVELTSDDILGMPFSAWADPYEPTSSTRILRPGLNLNHGEGRIVNGQTSDTERLNGLNSSQFLRSDITTYPLSTDTVYDLGSTSNRWLNFFAKYHYAGESTPSNVDVSEVNIFGKAKRAEECDYAEKAKAFQDPHTLTTANGNNHVAVVFSNVLHEIEQNTYEGTATITASGENKIKDLALEVAQDLMSQFPTGSFVRLDAPTVPTGEHNQGNDTQRWGTIYAKTFNGTATEALYADLAERYEADHKYAPGTLLSIGGEKEVTLTSGAYDYNYFGVVSTNPGVLLNSNENNRDNDMFPPVALAGRVPVRVIGPVRKGQRIALSELQGVARAVEDLSTVDPYFIVGRALETKTTDEEGLVLCVVGAK